MTFALALVADCLTRSISAKLHSPPNKCSVNSM